MHSNFTSGSRLERKPTRGLSLLELLIVLAVIAGLMALAWPNLRKPLEQSPLNQSAALIREMFDECRYQATLRGEMTLVRLQRDSNRLQMGTWETLLSEQLQTNLPSDKETSENSGTNNTDIENQNGVKAPFTLLAELPEGIVVHSVSFSISPVNNAISETDTLSESAPGSGMPQAEISDTLTANAANTSTDYWYVPFLPSGQSKDVSIILQDTQTGKRVMLQQHHGNGLTEIHKLPDAQSDDIGSDNATRSTSDTFSPQEPL